jgi:hypothetical protein
MLAPFRFPLASKEARHGIRSPPPRLAIAPPQPAMVVPLEQLWTRLPQLRQQETLRQLTQLLARRLAPANGREAADE